MPSKAIIWGICSNQARFHARSLVCNLGHQLPQKFRALITTTVACATVIPGNVIVGIPLLKGMLELQEV